MVSIEVANIVSINNINNTDKSFKNINKQNNHLRPIRLIINKKSKASGTAAILPYKIFNITGVIH